MKITMDSGMTIAETLMMFAEDIRDIRKAIVEGKKNVNVPKRLTQLRTDVECAAREFEVKDSMSEVDDLDYIESGKGV